MKKISVVTGLLHRLGVQSVNLLPILRLGLIFGDHVGDGRGLALLGDELVEQDASEERGYESNRSFLRVQSQHIILLLFSPSRSIPSHGNCVLGALGIVGCLPARGRQGKKTNGFLLPQTTRWPRPACARCGRRRHMFGLIAAVGGRLGLPVVVRRT